MTEVAEPEAKRWVGGDILRKEDPNLITGQGRYVDDVALPGMLWLAYVRSPVAHAAIASIDTSAAKELPGVQAVFTGQGLADDWVAALPCAWPIANRRWPDEPTHDPRVPDHWPVAKERVRYMGEIVAVVVADSREHAADAVEAVEVDYDELPVVTDIEEALQDGSPLVHEEFGSNEAYTWVLEKGEVDRVFAEAPVVVKERYVHPRLIPNAIEPRSVAVQPIPAQGEYTVWSATQIPHFLHVLLALCLGIPETKLHVIGPNVGGGFGSKVNVYAEEVICLAVARRLGMPVKWTEERSEGYLATIHGRGVVQDMEVAATEEGKTLGFRVKMYADFGAYMQLATPAIPILGAWLYHGVYEGQAYGFEATGVFTNKTPTDAYRGSGRPEATYAVERIMDTLARRVGKDPAEIREMNFIPPFTEAREVVSGLSFDSGNYPATMEKAKRLVGYDEVRREQQANDGRREGKLLGVGISTYIEMSGIGPSQTLSALKYGACGWEAATIRSHPTGKMTVVTGTSPHGQGHVTTWSQIVADALGVSPDDVEVVYADAGLSPINVDAHGSRSASVGGEAVYRAAEKIRAKARTIAAHELEVAEDDLEWVNGRFQVKGAPDRARTIPELAYTAWTAHALPAEIEPGLEATAVWDPPNFTFPSGAHICVVEVDPETGSSRIDRYVAVDDCGTVINPMIVDGQVMGGIAQGIAEALYEEAIYDESGTLLTGNMSTYRIPSAAELPRYTLDRTLTPSSTNTLGVKGISEAGITASPPAVLNAVADALRFVGVEFIDKPASAERIWRAIQTSHGQAPDERVPEGSGTGPVTMAPEGEAGPYRWEHGRIRATRLPEVYRSGEFIPLLHGRVWGGTAVVLHSPEDIAGLRALCAVAEQASENALGAVYRAISIPPFDLEGWKAIADEGQLYFGRKEPLDADIALPDAPGADSRPGVDFLQLLLSIAEDIWIAQDEDAGDVRLVVAVADPAAYGELQLELGQPALLLHPGSIVARLARNALKVPVFFLGLAVGGGAFADTRIATAINRLRTRAKRRYPGSPVLPDIRTIDEVTLAGKQGLVAFIHGLLATDVGLFDRLITTLAADDKLLLVGFPHDTLAAIDNNGDDLAHELRTRVGVHGPPVGFIAHSRGGLVARSAITRLIAGNPRWRERLRTCITFGTPHRGAAAAGSPTLFIGAYITYAWVRSTGTLLTGLPDILSYWTEKGEFKGIDDLKPDGAFLQDLRRREGEDGMDVFAIGGKNEAEGVIGMLTKRLYGDLENDWVVETTSSTRKLFFGTRIQQTNCNHFKYFEAHQQEYLDEAVRHLRLRLSAPSWNYMGVSSA